MKQKDILIIVLVAGVSALVSLFIANALFGGDKAYKLTAPTVSVITKDFKSFDEKYVNKTSLNVTKTITIGDSTNDKPFNQ